jgi:hypothetical protein
MYVKLHYDYDTWMANLKAENDLWTVHK